VCFVILDNLLIISSVRRKKVDAAFFLFFSYALFRPLHQQFEIAEAMKLQSVL